MPKAAKRFASQHARSITLSDNPETCRIREIAHSRIGFAAQEHRVKTKYRTRLARQRKALQASPKYIDASASDRERMEAQCLKGIEDDKLRELQSVAEEWLTIVRGKEAESNVQEPEGGDESDDGAQSLEYEEWTGIQDDVELRRNKEMIKDDSCKEWETEEEDDDDDKTEDEEEDGFAEGPVDVSDDEILYDKDGNIIAEEDVGKGLKEIMEFHMNRLRKRLGVFAGLASMEEPDSSSE